ncbi:hypothetical protein ACCO45_000617 [Purpureocillium lilacinum]|uniref:Uncharacterized protein n=1 Tax=Purpureocillium lilacinum TaxID=33203 RepID=A0ACC4E5J7_PURLI
MKSSIFLAITTTSSGEEVVVYPAFEKHLGAKGKEMAGYDRMEHHQVKELLKSFSRDEVY